MEHPRPGRRRRESETGGYAGPGSDAYAVLVEAPAMAVFLRKGNVSYGCQDIVRAWCPSDKSPCVSSGASCTPHAPCHRTFGPPVLAQGLIVSPCALGYIHVARWGVPGPRSRAPCPQSITRRCRKRMSCAVTITAALRSRSSEMFSMMLRQCMA